MKLQALTEGSSVSKWVPNEELMDAQDRVLTAAIVELEASFETAMKAHFHDFKLIKETGQRTQLMSSFGRFTLYGVVWQTSFSSSGSTLQAYDFGDSAPKTTAAKATVMAGSIEAFVEKMYEKLKNRLTKEILDRLNPSAPSFRADYLKLQQDFVDRDLEIEIDHVPDQKTVLMVTSDDKKLPLFKVKVK